MSEITGQTSRIYDDSSYLACNSGWHVEDSPYKANFVAKAIGAAGFDFATVADIGCGAGLVTELLAERFPHAQFTGLDTSQDVQRIWPTRRELKNLQYRSGSVEAYDLIICLDVFEHVEDYYSFLRDLRRRGQRFVFNIPLDMNAVKVATSGIRNARESVGHLHYFNEYTALETLRDCGYQIEWSMLSVAFLATPPRNLKQAVLLPLRLASLVFGKRFAAKMMGGISLVVAAS